MIIVLAAAVIGFEDEAYTVAEEDGNVQVFVTLMRGELTGDVTIQFATEEGTATSSGMYSALTNFLKILNILLYSDFKTTLQLKLI